MTFREYFGKEKEFSISAPGRVEIGGNHTDHQGGCVFAGAVNLYCKADVSRRADAAVRLYSEGFGEFNAGLNNLEYDKSEEGTTLSLIKGVAQKFRELDPGRLCGFDAFVSSQVLPGSGLSSSAAFEVMLARIFNKLGEYKADNIDIAGYAQYAENKYYGKPCGLMDQLACSAGALSFIDFKDKESPRIEKAEFDLKDFGYSLCIVNAGADHAALTCEYAAIPAEMKEAASYFGKELLSEVDEADFYSELSGLRKSISDRALLRSMHYFEETKRARDEFEAVRAKDINKFLALVRESGRSSFEYLQNVIPGGSIAHQDMAFVIKLCENILGKEGAVRVHGGGFAGTALAFVPAEKTGLFCSELEKVLGPGCVLILDFCS